MKCVFDGKIGVKEENAMILESIARLDESIKKTSAILKAAKEERDNLIWQAQERKITRAGNYELVPVVKINRTVDIVAVRIIVEDDELLGLCHPTLKELSQVMTEKQIDKCTIKTPSTSYKVRRLSMEENEDL